MADVVHHRQTSHLSVKHPAQGLMRGLVDASRVRTPVLVRTWPRWSRRIPTRIAHGIGHGHARVFMEFHWQQGDYPNLADSAPNATCRVTTTAHADRALPSTRASEPDARAGPGGVAEAIDCGGPRRARPRPGQVIVPGKRCYVRLRLSTLAIPWTGCGALR